MVDLSKLEPERLSTPPQSAHITALKLRLLGAHRPVIVAGAGLAEPSGMPLLRNPDGPEKVPELDGPFDVANVEQQWQFWDRYRRSARASQPNPAHRAIDSWAEWFRRSGPGNLGVQGLSIITTSPDGIALRVFDDDVPLVQLHGSAHRGICTRNPVHRFLLDDDDFTTMGAVPACRVCGAPLRPGVVLDGELPAEKDRAAAQTLIRQCDLVVFVGTSGRSASTMTLLNAASSLRIPCVLFNDRPWDHIAPFVAGADGDVSQTLPAVLPYPDDDEPAHP